MIIQNFVFKQFYEFVGILYIDYLLRNVNNSQQLAQRLATLLSNFMLTVDKCAHLGFGTKKKYPKLGGFGKVVEMDESFFAGAPKFNRGRRLGTSWEDDEKWVFGLVQRDSLNCVLKQVPSNRSRKTLLPIINKHCLEGTIFHSDGWKAYGKLADQLDLEDCLHFPVNHSSNYVDPDTGAHTQTIEGLWSHVKDFLPVRGMKPHDLHSYLGWFMWDRNCREMRRDIFIHFMKCAGEQRPPSYKVEFQLPPATITRILRQTESDVKYEDFIV